MAFNTQRVNCGLLNIQSARNKTSEIRDTINDRQLDLYAVTETWLTDLDSAAMKEMTPVTHSFVHNPRSIGRGGGVGMFVSNSVKKVKKCKTPIYNSFELLQVECEIGGNKLTIVSIYRPPAASVSLFIDEFELYLETIDMVSTNIIVWGDFNLWLDDTKARYVQLFIETIAMFNLINIVDKPTSMCGHIIDLVLVDTSSDLVRDLYVDGVCSLSPVHKLVSFKVITFRSTRNMDCDTLLLLIYDMIMEQQSDLCCHSSRKRSECHECLYTIYNSVMRVEHEKMCPLTSKKIVVKEDSPWFNDEIRRAKNDKKKKERLWRRQQTDQCRVAYTQARNYEKKLISRRKRDFYQGKIEQAGPNMHKLYKVLDNLTGNKKKHKLPEGYSDSELAN
ncbi:uncharacterized protein LOC143034331 [Oratosquilla oratoria]|uniref:uncharacterized protein LOC143034331 n=1 Tax=Oratosquilla oratoria TaxID=337810 RepID=UPI003F767933